MSATTALAGDTPPIPDPACAPVLIAVRTLATARGGIEARLIEASRVVVAACGDELLTIKDFTSVDELTPAQRRRWRAEAKAAAADELIATLGLSQTEARDLVGISLAGGQIPHLVIGALEAGWATWAQVRAFWRRCHAMPVQEAELVALVLFGDQADLAHPDRLDPDGALSKDPWEYHSYNAALAAEATRVDGKDPAAERARRKAAYLARHMTITIDEDGTATLALTGDLIALCAAFTRIDTIARLLRKHGDSRTLPQLCFDTAAALLVHGHIPGLDKDPDDLTEDDLQQLARIISAQPAIDLQVVVPLDTLTGSPACPNCGHGLPTTAAEDATEPEGGTDPASGSGADNDFGTGVDNGTGGEDGPGVDTHDPGPPGSPAGSPPGPSPDSWPESPPQPPPDSPSGSSPEPWPRAGWAPPRSGGLAELVGRHPTYLSPGQARELALRPGTTITRLLTDARDGRLLERSRTGYRPDADMRAQIIAADRYCRGPLGTRRPAETCELDHVIPYHAGDDGTSTGGDTSPANLAALAQHPHHRKTRDELRVAINARRDLAWTTLLAATVDTRSHDYRQYYSDIRTELGPHDASDQDIEASYRRYEADAYRHAADDLLRAHHGRPPAQTPRNIPAGDLTDDDRDLLRQTAARALYAALVHRGPHSMLADPDDHPGATEHGGPLAGWMFVTHTHPRTGTRQPGPAPEHPTPEQVLGMPPHPADRVHQQQVRHQQQDVDSDHGHGHGPHREHPRAHGAWARWRYDQPPPF